MRIKALNEPETSTSVTDESSNDVEKPQNLGKEAQEDQCFEKYRQALLALSDNRHDEGRELLGELEDDLEDLRTESEALVQLKFSVLRNLGNLEEDLDHYIRALEIDSSDISLWIKTGDRAMKLKNFSFARISYEQALNLNPNNWLAIDRLVEIYYVLHLPFELHDICSKALSMNSNHTKAKFMIEQAKNILPSLREKNDTNNQCMMTGCHDVNRLISDLDQLKRKRQSHLQNELQQFKRARLSITLDTARTQSLASFGNYVIKIYERFAKQCITRNTIIDITINNTMSFSQQLNIGSINSQSNNQNSSENQTTSSQDVEMAMESEVASNSETEKSINKLESATSNDGTEPPKNNINTNRRSNQSFQKNSSLSFAAMLFPMDLNDKRRSSRNRNNQDDTFSFKMKFDELNELLPECLRIGAIEQTLQKRRKEQQIDNDADKEDSQEESLLSETNLDPIREDLLIQEIIGAISVKAQSNGTTIGNVKLCYMFYVYLSKLSAKKQATIPEAFTKIYRIYRKLCPISNDVFIEIGLNGIDLDELWFTLTANEIKYNERECMFLLRMLSQLQMHLDEAQHKEFSVRLFLVLGMNFDYKYLTVALENIEEDTKVCASNRKIITRAYVKTLIDKNVEKQQREAANDSDNPLDIIDRLAPKSENEMSDREITLLCQSIEAAKVWQRGLDILNQRNDLNIDIIIDTLNTCLKNDAKMDAILASKLCKEAITSSRPTTWTCLYRGWCSVLTEEELLSQATIDSMDEFFDLGHQSLGKKGTCTADNGEFLYLFVNHLLHENRNNYEERHVLAAIHCLFGYPNKKPASVANHKATKVPVVWEYAELIYSFIAPSETPTYMSSLRKVGITNELEIMFKEIEKSVPEHCSPRTGVHVIENFIEKNEPLPDITLQPNEITSDLYYFLADYYFKNKDFNTAKQYYHLDLAVNPNRFDSWAASGLIRASYIDKALSDGTVTTEDFISGSFRDLTNSAIRCFECAVRVEPNEPKATLWIEYGNLAYNLTSLAARLYTYDDFEMDIEGKEPLLTNKLIERHKALFKIAKRCFLSANQLCVCDEVWLHYYMLGKIYEKADALKALEYYQRADAQLFHEGATYPRKISYHNPPDLAYEAMEVHYRIHAAALKFLLMADELSQEQMNRIKRILLNAQRSPFVQYEACSDPKKSVMENLDKDVKLLIDDVIDSVEEDANFDELVFMCLHGVKRCLVRCDKNFKALYRLAYYYRKIRDCKMAQDILISRELKIDKRIRNLIARQPNKPAFMSAPPNLEGVDSLFKDKKLGNLFFNIWRMPIEEIDRPGAFEHWMFKSTWLLIRVCHDVEDTNVLSTVAFQLSRQPETSKKYLHDRPRMLLALFAVKSIIQIISDSVDQAVDHDTRQHSIREGMILADKFIKANVFSDKMRELYTNLQNLCVAL